MIGNNSSATPQSRVLLTGAFGGVGEWLIRVLLEQGHHVICLDKASAPNRTKKDKLAKQYKFDTAWGDITDADGVKQIVLDTRPNLVVHAAAIIPPLTFKRPDLARAVNVAGTKHLVDACIATGTVDRFVLVSSYSVLGPSNPHRDPPRWTCQTPVNPQDEYARQKVEAEAIVATSSLPSVIVRLCAVFPLSVGAMDPDMLLFSFILPYDRREHAIDVRDAALAIANAATAPDVEGKTFVVGGGEGWASTGGALASAMMEASGLRSFPPTAYRRPDPAVDASWYYENWVDTTQSELALGYQRHSFAEFLAERRRISWGTRLLGPLIGGLILRILLRKSPYFGTDHAVDAGSFTEAVRKVLNRR